MSGYGVQLQADGKEYYGQWSQNDMEGYGFQKETDKARYDGQFSGDKK